MELLTSYKNPTYVRERIEKLLALPDAQRPDLGKRIEWNLPHRRLTQEQTAELVELYQSGHSLAKVAQQLEVNNGTIRNALKQRGVVGTN